MDLDRLQIRIEADSKSASASINRLVNKLDKLSSSMSKLNTAPIENFTKSATKLNNLNFSSLSKGMNKTSGSMKSMSKSSHSLAASFGKFYASYFLVIRGIKGLWNSIGKTADYMEALNYYTVSFNKIAGDWNKDWEKYGYKNAEEYSSSFVERMNETLRKLSGVEHDAETGLLSSTSLKNLGLNIQEVTQYASQLASVTNSVGQTGEVSLATASALTKLAGDMSSLFNVDYSAVAKNLQSGLIGQSRALYKYGIDITNATLQTYAYEQGLEKAVSEMTQAEKMQLRILAILDQSKVAWGDQANTINSLSNGIRMLKNNLSEAGMVLGQLFVPLMQRIIPIANGATIAIKGLLTNLAGFLGIEIDADSFGKGFADGSEGLDEFTDGLEDVTSAAKKAKMGLRGFDELNVLNSGSGSGTGNAMASFDLTEQIKKATEEYEAYWAKAYENMQSKAEEFAKKISKALEPVNQIFKDLSVGDWFSVGEDVSKLATGILDLFTKAVGKVDWTEVGAKIGDFLKGINWSEILTAVGEAIGTAIKSGFELVAGMFSAAPIETALIGSLAFLKFTGVGTIIGTKIAAAFTSAMGTAPILDLFKAGFKALFGSEAAKSALAFMLSDFVSAAMLGIKIAVPIGVVIGSMAFEWEVGKERKQLEENVGKYGETVGRHMSGSGYFDKQALYDHDVDKANADLTSSYLYMYDQVKEKISQFFSDWGTKIDTHKTNVTTVNTEITQSYIDMFTNIGKEIGKWFNEKAKPWFTKEKWQGLGENIKTSLQEKWKSFTNWWQATGVSKWFNEKVKPWFTKAKWQSMMAGIKEGFSAAFKNAANAAIEIFNSLIRWINDKMDFSWNGISILGKTIVPAGKVKLITIPEIPKFAVGGFPEDGLFMANHSELVGKFSNGRTAVANNDQITQGIADAVYPAVYNAVSAAFANKSADPIRVYVGDRELTDIVVDGINQRTRAGHQPLYGW